MATIKDVAARAGVSVGTVSRVLANNQTVKQPLREKVSDAVAELGYKPNLAARALRTNRIDVIGVIVPDITNPFFAQIAKEIEIQAADMGHSVMLANTHDDQQHEAKQISALLDRSPRGIIVIAATDNGNFAPETDIPIVALDRPFGDFPFVSTDHEAAAALIADHICDLGVERVAYIAGPQSTQVARVRKAGFVNRISQRNNAGSQVELQIEEALFDYASGENIARRLLGRPVDQRPHAIVAASDQQAIGALRAALDLKLRVPDDVLITGFDDIALASLVVPRLTTIRQPSSELARRALELVLDPTELRNTSSLLLPGELIVRGSSGGPRKSV
ncbi:LacI family DNA-binding transcriptional regulator [Thalassospira lucentensis]|uniref:LacI family DNA-binding transcriptional regulator n=1 Tax=Thalassospira lucentensis TaxID=168935 RepID=UPI003AA81A03